MDEIDVRAGLTPEWVTDRGGLQVRRHALAWYEGGGAPLISPAVRLWPEPIQREMRPPAREPREPRGHVEEARAEWIYFTGTEYPANATTASSAAKSGKKAARTYTNEDVERQNQNNGTVKYAGKTEKIK